MNLYLTAFLVMFAVAINDIFWALYISHAAEGNKFKASFHAVLILATASFATMEYVNNRWMVIPALIGAFVGTYIGMMLKEKNVSDS